MNLKVKKILSLFAGILILIPLYVALHEGGHALTAVLCGARITQFRILGAYMAYEGGRFTSLTLSLFHISGMLLPVLVSILYSLAYRGRIESIFYQIFSFLFILIPTGSILAWVIVPILYLLGQAPQTDDAAKFIDSSGLSPWVVLLGAILLFACCLFLAGRKKSFRITGPLLSATYNMQKNLSRYSGTSPVHERLSLPASHPVFRSGQLPSYRHNSRMARAKITALFFI